MPAGYDKANKITTFDIFEEAERKFHNILKEFRAVLADEAIGGKITSQHPVGLAVPKNHPSLIQRGTTALVFSLPVIHEEYHWTGKGLQNPRYILGKTSFYATLNKSEYLLAGKASGLDPRGLEKTIISLTNLGYHTPPMKEVCRTVNGRDIFFTLMPDLSENKRYEVEDAETFDFARLLNGEEIQRTYQESVSRIQDAVERGLYELTLEGHCTQENPLQGIQHIFFIKYVPQSTGKLIIGDLNHLVLSPKRRNQP